MVGDRLYTDIATGKNFGMLSILVLTGEAKRSDLETSEVQPDLIFERLSSMNEYL
ncbi:MAG: HAD hydrolase-like protein, partial [Clostridia bacterium]